jgi:hypothetical protein
MTILAMIGGALAGAFAIGFRVLGPTGAQAKLTGNHDLLAFEQQIGADVARADCMAAPLQTTIPSPGGCSSTSFPSRCLSGYVLCVAWYVPGSATCHTITYSQASVTKAIVRNDDSGTTTQRISTGGVSVSATWSATATTNNTYLWTTRVDLTVGQQSAPGSPTPIANPASTVFHLVPLAADPLSPVLPTGSSAC